MDGFRERLSGRFDRSAERVSPDRACLDRSSSERYERPARRSSSAGYGVSDSIGAEAVSEAIDKSNTKQLEIISEFFEDAKDDRLASEKEILHALDESMGMLNNIRQDVSGRDTAPVQAPLADTAAKEEIMQAVLGNTSLLNTLRQEVAAYTAAETEKKPEQNAEGEQESQALLTAIDNYFKNMEDHVHKENVKCYRNVQAAITEQNAAAVEQTKKNLGALKVFAIISMVLSVVNIGLLAAFIFGVI